MKKKTSFVILLLLVSLWGCTQSGIEGNRELDTRAFVFDHFDMLEIDNVFLVDLYQADDYYVEIEAEENLMDYIRLRVDGETLKLAFKEKILPNHPIRVSIATPELKEITIRGACRLRTVEPFVTPSITINAQGASHVLMDLVADEVHSYSQGAAKIELSGSTNLLVKQMEGAGVFNGLGLGANNARVNLQGVGKISVNVSENLDVNIDGLGKVEYAGSPPGLVKNISGLGKIVAVGS
ncbi:head GIN domain-containing protein [Litoribacter populi]|uniref:head GIN domain-containing protein n=1 Tax=Litoribacter populi TaxID=2598460 RepID=UPI001180E5DA|nr:head GIN domain-containing protein [Litoribacter populi]